MKLTREQRKEIRRQLLEEKRLAEESEEVDEKSEEEVSNLTEARAIYRNIIDESTGETLSNIRQAAKSQKRQFIWEERSKLKVEIKWDIDVGDAVSFNHHGEEMFGMVVDQRADGEFRNASEAKQKGYVCVLSSAGKSWRLIRELTKIEE